MAMFLCSCNIPCEQIPKDDLAKRLKMNTSYHNPVFDKDDYNELFSQLKGPVYMDCNGVYKIVLKDDNKQLDLTPMVDGQPLSDHALLVDLVMAMPSNEWLMLAGYTKENEKVVITIEKPNNQVYVTKLRVGTNYVLAYSTIEKAK